MTQITDFGQLPDGQSVQRIQISGGGLTAQILTYGATVQDLRLDGVAHPLVLGSPMVQPYLTDFRYFGAIVGRFANRIAGGQFVLNGLTWALDRNDGGVQTLHGGSMGAGQLIWTLASVQADRVTLTLTLPDGHMGFPGTMQVQATYSLPGDGALRVDIVAQSDAPGPCSFAHHGYFNLDGSDSVLDHVLQVDSAQYLPVDQTLIPTGQIAPVAGTAFDFQLARPIGSTGYDHNLCLSNTKQPLRAVARLVGQNGVAMTVLTTEPGLQLYDGQKISAAGLAGLDGRRYGRNAGVALETQAWPDAPNQPAFPGCVLQVGQVSEQVTVYQFTR